MNKQLIEDEGHRNAMDLADLQKRMAGWVDSVEYTVQIFEADSTTVGYCVYKDAEDHIYLRQFFIGREFRRRGFGTAALARLAQIWPGRRLRLDVLSGNETGIQFWQASGFSEYAYILERLLPGESVFRHLKKN